MPLHFERAEYDSRIARAVAAMQARGLDGMLLFNQSSRYYLTGYDSFGFVLFECLYLGADGRLMLLTRPTDVPAAFHTSIITDVRVWHDKADADPARQLRDIVAEFGARGRKLGVEYQTWGLTGRNAMKVNAAFDGFATLVDESELIARLRLVKSDAELVYSRRAGELADAALAEARKLARAGAFEGDILAAAQGAVFKGGGDYPGNEFTIASAEGALLPRYFSGRRHLAEKDQLILQLGGAYRRYHASLMATILTGEADAIHRRMFAACHEALTEIHAALKPGLRIEEMYAIYARASERHGFSAEHRLSACGYSLGAAYHPTWMDWPWIFPGSDVIAEPNMVFYVHMILMDRENGRALALADTSVVTQTGSQRLSHAPLELLVV